jgi:hypothetical protein
LNGAPVGLAPAAVAQPAQDRLGDRGRIDPILPTLDLLLDPGQVALAILFHRFPVLGHRQPRTRPLSTVRCTRRNATANLHSTVRAAPSGTTLASLANTMIR